MNSKLMLGVGAMLVVVGVLALASSVLGIVFGFRIWQLWPLIVITAGLLMTAPAIFVRNRPLLSGLYILGLPTITTGVLLLFSSVFHWWEVWSLLWPLEVLSVALGCLLTAIKQKAPWLMVPAIIIGANGMILQFCTLTGWWRAWAVLWAVEPIAIGISLLTLNTRRHSRGLLTTGLVFCAIGALGFFEGMAIASLSALRPLWQLWRWLTPITIILIGAGLIIWNLMKKDTLPEAPVPAE